MINQMPSSVYPMENTEGLFDNSVMLNHIENSSKLINSDKRPDFEFMPYSNFKDLASNKDVFDYVEMHSSFYYSKKFNDFTRLPERNYVFCTEDMIVIRRIFKCLKKFYILTLIKIILSPFSFFLDFQLIHRIINVECNIFNKCSFRIYAFLIFCRLLALCLAFLPGVYYSFVITAVLIVNGLVFDGLQIQFSGGWPKQIKDFDENQKKIIIPELKKMMHFKKWSMENILIL